MRKIWSELQHLIDEMPYYTYEHERKPRLGIKPYEQRTGPPSLLPELERVDTPAQIIILDSEVSSQSYHLTTKAEYRLACRKIAKCHKMPPSPRLEKEKKPCHLLRLPAELRERIYELAIYTHYDSVPSRESFHQRPLVRSIEHPLLHISHFIRAEVLPTYLRALRQHGERARAEARAVANRRTGASVAHPLSYQELLDVAWDYGMAFWSVHEKIKKQFKKWRLVGAGRDQRRFKRARKVAAGWRL